MVTVFINNLEYKPTCTKKLVLRLMYNSLATIAKNTGDYTQQISITVLYYKQKCHNISCYKAVKLQRSSDVQNIYHNKQKNERLNR